MHRKAFLTIGRCLRSMRASPSARLQTKILRHNQNFSCLRKDQNTCDKLMFYQMINMCIESGRTR